MKKWGNVSYEFLDCFHFLYISLTLFSPTHTILTAHNFFAIFITTFKSYCLSSWLPKAWQSHCLLLNRPCTVIFFANPLCLFLEWQRACPVPSTWCTHRYSTDAPVLSAPLPCPMPFCPCASPTFHTDLPPLFPHPLPWPWHLSGVRQPWCQTHSRSMEGQGRVLLQSLVLSETQDPFWAGAPPPPKQPQDRGSSEDCTVLGHGHLPCASPEFHAWKGFAAPRKLHTQEAAPGDAEAKREERMYNKGETEAWVQVPATKRWIPKEESGTVLEGGMEKIQLARSAPGGRGEQGGRTAQKELLWVLRTINAPAFRYRMHFWRRKPWIHSQFYYTGLGVPAFSCTCSFPLCSLSVPAGPGGSGSHLISCMGFYRTHGTLQGTKVPMSTRKAPELAVGQSLVLAAAQRHSRDWAGVCTTSFAPRATTQLPLESASLILLLTALNIWHRSDLTLALQALVVNPIFPMGSFAIISIFDGWCSSFNSSDYDNFNTCGNTNTFPCVLHVPDPPEEWFLQGSLGCLHLPPMRCGLFCPSNRHPKLAFAGSPWPVTPTLPLNMIYVLG